MLASLKKYFSILFIIFVAFAALACDSNKDSDGGVNADIDPTLLSVTIEAIDVDGGVAVRMPLGIFGDAQSDLTGATIDFYVNGVLVAAHLDAADYYYSSLNAVSFYYQPAVAGEIMGFLVTTSSGSELYYEGVVSESETSQAPIAVADGSISAIPGEIGQFFDDTESAVGDASGTSLSSDYLITFATMTFSSDCTADFMSAVGFEVSSSMTTEEINGVIADGLSLPSFTTRVTQNNGSLIWDNLSSTVDYAGIVNSDGSFTLFDGSYIDESNFTYTLYAGQFDETTQTLSGTYTAQIALDGNTLSTTTVGSCTATAAFSGSVE